MSRAAVITALAAGAALAGAAYVWQRSPSPRQLLATSVVPIITPTIDLRVAEAVLAHFEHVPDDEVTVLLHTYGGCVTSCVLIADALRNFTRATAVVPYLAISGGTLIALNATHLAMGRNAALSAVDPIVYGQRARHIPPVGEDAPLRALADEYDAAMSRYLRQTLEHRLLDRRGKPGVDRAMAVFMGKDAPHEWPIRRRELQDLGLEVSPADRKWAAVIDAMLGRGL